MDCWFPRNTRGQISRVVRKSLRHFCLGGPAHVPNIDTDGPAFSGGAVLANHRKAMDLPSDAGSNGSGCARLLPTKIGQASPMTKAAVYLRLSEMGTFDGLGAV